MDQVLRSLGGLLLQSIPTFIIVILLYFYLKRIFFRPMERTLAARYEATEGARKLAEETMTLASQKAAEYENALRTARTEIYHEQEEFRQRLRQEQASALEEARTEAGAWVKDASQQLASELGAAKETLRQQTDTLAEEIAGVILNRRAS